MLFGSHEHLQEIESQWRRSRRRPCHQENGFVFSNHLFELIARARDASIISAGPALLAGVGFVFSKHSFGLIAQAHNASIILTRPALPTEDGFVLQNAHGLGATRNEKPETRNRDENRASIIVTLLRERTGGNPD
jgi:hypothetical protein